MRDSPKSKVCSRPSLMHKQPLQHTPPVRIALTSHNLSTLPVLDSTHSKPEVPEDLEGKIGIFQGYFAVSERGVSLPLPSGTSRPGRVIAALPLAAVHSPAVRHPDPYPFRHKCDK